MPKFVLFILLFFSLPDILPEGSKLLTVNLVENCITVGLVVVVVVEAMRPEDCRLLVLLEALTKIMRIF
jgi:hypothetical protein